MKKRLLLITLIVSSFVGINSVKAETCTYVSSKSETKTLTYTAEGVCPLVVYADSGNNVVTEFTKEQVTNDCSLPNNAGNPNLVYCVNEFVDYAVTSEAKGLTAFVKQGDLMAACFYDIRDDSHYSVILLNDDVYEGFSKRYSGLTSVETKGRFTKSSFLSSNSVNRKLSCPTSIYYKFQYISTGVWGSTFYMVSAPRDGLEQEGYEDKGLITGSSFASSSNYDTPSTNYDSWDYYCQYNKSYYSSVLNKTIVLENEYLILSLNQTNFKLSDGYPSSYLSRSAISGAPKAKDSECPQKICFTENGQIYDLYDGDHCYEYTKAADTVDDHNSSSAYLTGDKYRNLLCDLHPYLRDNIKGITVTKKLLLKGSEVDMSEWGCNNTISVCSSSDIECQQNIEYNTGVLLKNIAFYCNKVYEDYAKLRNTNAKFEERVNECISFDGYYLNLVETGVINSLDSDCGLSGDALELINFFLDIIKIAGPLIAIGLGILDFFRVVVSTKKNEEEMKNAGSRFMIRIISAILLLLVPVILSFLMNLFLSGQSGYDKTNPFCLERKIPDDL